MHQHDGVRRVVAHRLAKLLLRGAATRAALATDPEPATRPGLPDRWIRAACAWLSTFGEDTVATSAVTAEARRAGVQ